MSLHVKLAIAALFATACSSKPPKELDVYTYRITIDQEATVETWIGTDFTLAIGDKVYPMKHGEVGVPKDVWLTKSPLSMVIETTCGPRKFPLANIYSDEAQMRRSAAKYDQAIAWKLKVDGELDVKRVGIVVDNHDNPKPVTARVGTVTQQVAAGAHATVSGYVGTCDTAREVAIDDKVLGTAKTDGTSTLVDAIGDRCYLLARDWYGALAVEPSRDKLQAYAPQLYTIDAIDNWFTPNPSSTTVRVRNTESDKASAGTALTSLTHTDCTRAARR